MTAAPAHAGIDREKAHPIGSGSYWVRFLLIPYLEQIIYIKAGFGRIRAHLLDDAPP